MRVRPRTWLERRVVDPLFAALAYGAYAVFGLLPVTWSSGAIGWLARMVGPHLPATQRARHNLVRCFPEKSAAEIETIMRDMWEHLGRYAGEYPGIKQLLDDSIRDQAEAIGVDTLRKLPPEERPVAIQGKYTEVVGVENFVEMREDGKPALLFSGHFGNWELLPLAAERFGLRFSALFRTPNNPYVARLILHLRRGMGELLPKGVEGALASARVLEKGGHLGMLVDQKLNRGLAIPFFGRTAMTSPTLAKLAYRYRCPVYGARVERIKGTRFRIFIDPPMELPQEEDEDAFVEAMMIEVNKTVERWVRGRPDHWFWLHRRWPD